MMRPNRKLPVLALALVLASTASAPLRAAEPTPGIAAAAVLAQQELDFVRLAQRLHASQQAAARLALAHSRDVRVRQFARQILRDHSAAGARLQRIVAGKGWVLSGPADTRAAATFGLEGLRGVAFDRRFVAAVGIDGHRDAVRIFGLQERWGQEPVLVRFASSQLPVLGRLLARAESLSTQFQLRRRNFQDAHNDTDAGAGPSRG